ncbi:PAS, putative [Acanthamoeba castellanii str. Neff]|uniref:PAS, putative n=1 Tax=Acanthamoeba castellanii (strain ATCC 30010 / Neff) TaxID=1257118 RepID=L8H077_ACACF|nr:PAS, putative [Acanthamoeba castellanii str. Neff]ELR18625.1 PAS, putative [Acanthamoeba castellanii str. Neff]
MIEVEHLRRLGDPLRFRQMVFNLASNALKFTPEGGTITISVSSSAAPRQATKNNCGALQSEPACCTGGKEEDDDEEEKSGHDPTTERADCSGKHCASSDEITVEVTDTGIGIPEDHLPLLFKADASTTRMFGGSGLGLAICKRLSRLMGGKIGVRSKRNEGSTFWFSLPLPHASETDELPTEATQSTTPLTSSGEARARSADALLGVKALLVEDNPFNQKIGVKMLSRAGSSVTVACNGEQCLRVLDEQGPFDVVLMDCHMPIMDGLEATRRIREKEKLDHKQHRIPIIALTASTTPDDKAQCTQAGMDGWLGKPFDRALLCATIRRYVPLPPAPAPAASPPAG